MRLVFAGTPEVALPSLSALLGAGHDVVAVLTRPDAARGRSRRLVPSPVGAWAEDHGLYVLKPPTLRDPAFVDDLRALAPDACPVVAYGAMIPDEALTVPRFGWINLHFSLLPRWRGAAPVQRAIMAGDAQVGTATFRIVKALDAGDLYSVESMPMPDLTAGELLDELARSGARQLVATMDAIEGGTRPTPQDDDGITIAPKLTVEEARIDWSLPAAELRNRIMGCSPDPGAWCELRGERFKIHRARTTTEQADLAPGVLATTKRQAFVGTGSGALELLEVQPAGKRRMAAMDWARNAGPGTVLA